MTKYKIEIKWAFIFALISLVWMFIEKSFGLHDENIDKHATYTNFVAIPAILVYVFALLDKRKNYYNGIMTYKESFISGLIITLIVTALSPLTQLITSLIITPNYFENAIKYSVESGLSTQEAAESYFTLSNYIVQGLIGAPIMGILTSAIVSFFTRKK